MKIIAIGDFHCKFPEKLKKIIKREKPDLILSTGDYAGNREWRPLLKKAFKSRQNGNPLEIEDILGKKKYLELLKRDYAQGKYPISELEKFNVPVLSVFGNGDWYKSDFNSSNKDYESFIKKLNHVKNIDHKCVKFKNLRIIGFGGYLDPDIYFTERGKRAICASVKGTINRKKCYLLEEKRLMKLMRNKPLIILSHYTPLNCLDKLSEKGFVLCGENMGVSSYNRAIKKYKPALFICGHMHENQGKGKIGKTLIVNPGAAVEGKMAIINFDEFRKKVLGVRFIK